MFRSVGTASSPDLATLLKTTKQRRAAEQQHPVDSASTNDEVSRQQQFNGIVRTPTSPAAVHGTWSSPRSESSSTMAASVDSEPTTTYVPTVYRPPSTTRSRQISESLSLNAIGSSSSTSSRTSTALENGSVRLTSRDSYVHVPSNGPSYVAPPPPRKRGPGPASHMDDAVARPLPSDPSSQPAASALAL